MIWVKFAKRYLAAFAAKDIDQLDSEVYADDIIVSDWSATTTGKEQVLISDKHLFDNTDLISIHIQNVAYNNKLIFIYFNLILINGQEKADLDVVSMIELNDSGKIRSITSFSWKGFSSILSAPLCANILSIAGPDELLIIIIFVS